MKIIGANFKMNLTQKEIINYLNIIENKLDKNKVIFFPTSLYLNLFQNKNYLTGSQDLSFKDFGSLTGDISIKQLKDFEISYSLIGHSERRNYFNDDKYISNKLNLALKNNIIPVLCLGENLEEYQNNLTKDKLKKQLNDAFKENINFLNENIIIAYEPVWAIGTGKIPRLEKIKEIIEFLKDYIYKNYHLNLKIIYGGSVNLNNIINLETISNLDGYLIGEATLDPYKFLDLITKIK